MYDSETVVISYSRLGENSGEQIAEETSNSMGRNDLHRRKLIPDSTSFEKVL